MNRLLQLSPPWRWLRSARAWLAGVRISPSAALLGRPAQFALGRATRIGARCRLDAGSTGRIATGSRVWLSSDVEIETAGTVHIGTGTTVQRRCTLNGETRVGRGCIFAPDVFVSSGTHPFRAVPHLPIRTQEQVLAADGSADHRPVWIQDDCWIGTHAVVCPGVTVGKGSVVGANAVVTRDVAPYSVVAGSPARPIGSRLDWQPPASLDLERAEQWPYVLDGTPASEDARQPAGLLLGPGQDAVIALAVSARAAGLAVELEAGAGQLSAGGEPVHWPGGRGQALLPLGPAAHPARPDLRLRFSGPGVARVIRVAWGQPDQSPPA